MARPPVVVVDTNVFGADLVRSTHRLVELYRPLLEGRRFLISFQTLAELRFGMHRRSWGERRLRRAEDHIGRAEVVWPGPRLLDAYVRLRVACGRAGPSLRRDRGYHHTAHALIRQPGASADVRVVGQAWPVDSREQR